MKKEFDHWGDWKIQNKQGNFGIDGYLKKWRQE